MITIGAWGVGMPTPATGPASGWLIVARVAVTAVGVALLALATSMQRERAETREALGLARTRPRQRKDQH